MTVVVEPGTVALPDLTAEVPCLITGCTWGAGWVATYSTCRCHATYCEGHKSWWELQEAKGNWVACIHHDHAMLDQRFVGWRPL